MQRWALMLSGYSYHIKYVPGRENKVADALSRLPTRDFSEPPQTVIHLLQSAPEAPLLPRKIRLGTERDPVLAVVKQAVMHGWPKNVNSELQPYSNRRTELSLHEGCLLWGNRIIAPPQERKRILQELHDAHPGIVRMKALARGYVWWPKIDSEIEALIKSSSICQRHQNTPPKVPLRPWTWPDTPWERVHIDYFGPFLGQMILVVVDAHTKWLEAIPTGHSSTATTTVSKLRSLFSTFGIPEMVVSDNGPAFTATEFSQFMSFNGINHLTTAPYHAASNGLAERAVQTVKLGLQKQTQGDLSMKFARFLLNYRVTPCDSTGSSPAELMFKRTLRTRLDLIRPNLQGRVTNKQATMKARYDAKARVRAFQPGEKVFTKLHFERHWTPATVIDSDGSLVDLQLNNGRSCRRHLDQIRPDTSVAPEMAEPEENADQMSVNGWSTESETGTDQTLSEGRASEAPDAQGAEPVDNSDEPSLRRSTRHTLPITRFQAET